MVTPGGPRNIGEVPHLRLSGGMRDLHDATSCSGCLTCTMNSAMTVTSDDRGTTLVALRGEFDTSSAPAVRAQIVAALAAGDTTIVLDLSKVSFIDAVALGVLVGGWRRVRAAGGELTVAAVTSPVRQVLEMTGFTDLLSTATGRPGPSSPPPPPERPRRAW